MIAEPETKTFELTLTRTIPALKTEVYDAWLNPNIPCNPWHDAEKLILDPKVDGLFYWCHLNEDGERRPHFGRFTVVNRANTIEHTWMSMSTHGLETVVTVTFQEKGDETLVTLRHAGLPDDEWGHGHEGGWSYFVGLLEEHFAR